MTSKITYTFPDASWQVDPSKVTDAADLATLSALTSKGDAASEKSFVELLAKYPGSYTKNDVRRDPPPPANAPVSIDRIMADIEKACFRREKGMKKFFRDLRQAGWDQQYEEAKKILADAKKAAEMECHASQMSAYAEIGTSIASGIGSGAGAHQLWKSRTYSSQASKAEKQLKDHEHNLNSLNSAHKKTKETDDKELGKAERAHTRASKNTAAIRQKVTELRKKIRDAGDDTPGARDLDRIDADLAAAKQAIKKKIQEKERIDSEAKRIDEEIAEEQKKIDKGDMFPGEKIDAQAKVAALKKEREECESKRRAVAGDLQR